MDILLYIGSAIIFIWSIAHIIPTKSVVKGFGEISDDNTKTITMERAAEGITLCFIGLLVLLVTTILVACAKPPSTLPPPSVVPTTPSVVPSAPARAPTPATGIEIGNLAPDFTLQYMDGKTFSLSGVRGKPVLLNFWTTCVAPAVLKCPSCNKYTRNTQAITWYSLPSISAKMPPM